ncbi:MAG: 30S ribosomal protein S4 [Bacillota bacterium]|jgi:small subunit ribosomal protein S4|nr:30S ribosomal protein S4 [Bacillota bacterium]NLU54672.1 30S ribosomal protein S4 [Bacillota bacterium]HOA90487.1 30S ribosomal protein S4 [Bacillota bacterium]HPQ10458.1 30S ribosomal protein S4 [Bacillota bacterium]HPZ72611.1 30S ribosomal protein S4 [Bacillota bacterium]
MARYLGPVCKICRREGQKLFLKGDRCYSDKCAFDRRPYAPGQHGQSRKKLSEYALHLREKQKARRIYGVLEAQFVRYFKAAEAKKGVTGDILMQTLERRLDNVVYRLGFARSRAEARQIVRHGHIAVNGKKNDIPSYLVNEGEVIAIRAERRDAEVFAGLQESLTNHKTPAWLELDVENLQGKVLHLPERSEIDVDVQEQLIVELY